MATSAKQRIYIFDANVFIRIDAINANEIELPQTFWDELGKLLTDGTVISHRIIFEEVVIKSKKMDVVSAWMSAHSQSFYPETETQVVYTSEIIKAHPRLIDCGHEKDQADPWLIAMARELSESNDEFEYVIVTQENERSEYKIPLVAQKYGIKSMNLKAFLKEIGINLST